MASLIVFFRKCLPNLYKVHLCKYIVLFNIYMVHLTSVQLFSPSERGDYISVMSDIVSFHSKRLEHLAIHFGCESY